MHERKLLLPIRSVLSTHGGLHRSPGTDAAHLLIAFPFIGDWSHDSRHSQSIILDTPTKFCSRVQRCWFTLPQPG